MKLWAEVSMRHQWLHRAGACDLCDEWRAERWRLIYRAVRSVIRAAP